MENDPRASSIEPDLLAIVAKIEPYDFSQSQFRLIACFTEIKRHFEQTRDGGPFEDLSPKLIFEAGILAARIGFEPIPIEPYNATTDDGLCISGLQFSQPYDRASFVLPLHVTDSSDEQSKRRPGKATCQKIIDLLDRWALAAEGAIPSQLRKGRFTPAKWAIATFNRYQWEVALRAFLPELPPEDDAPPAEPKPPTRGNPAPATKPTHIAVIDLKTREPDQSAAAIAERLGMPRSTVNHILKKYQHLLRASGSRDEAARRFDQHRERAKEIDGHDSRE